MNSQFPQTVDASIWAKEFVKAVQQNPLFVLDEGTMMIWFANAIMAGWDGAEQRHRKNYDDRRDWDYADFLENSEQ